MIKGKNIILSSVEEEDLPLLLEWRNNPDYRRYYREYRELTLEHQKKWYKERCIGDDRWQFFVVKAIDEDSDNKVYKTIGSCGLTYINWTSRTAEFAITIGDPKYRGKRLGGDTLRTLIKYGFEELNLNRIWCEVYSNNAAISVYKHIGFVEEGVLRENYYCEGKYWDSHILSMLKSEYEKDKQKNK
jgi:RimJ/RimL family protein N-acetyltransferase